MNKRYQFLLDSEYRKLKFAFEESKNFFKKEDVKNHLLHPGEYGAYRERACKEFLKFILPKTFNVGDGFIINAINEETTQCDLIIYKSDDTPVIRNDEYTRFFPCETTLAIGEVKSILNKNELFDCLKKLSNNKKIRKIQDKNYKDSETTDPFTFLICESIQGFCSELAEDINDFYEKEQVEPRYRHNFILSLKEGYISYIIDNDTLSKLAKYCSPALLEKYKEFVGYDLWYTCCSNICFKTNLRKVENPHWFFTSILNNFLECSTSYYPDPTYYLY